MLKIGLTQSKIAEVTGIHKSTVSRKLKRNRGGRGYPPKQADAFAKERHQAKSSSSYRWQYLGLYRATDSRRVESGTNKRLDEKEFENIH